MTTRQQIAIGAFFILMFGYFILRRWIADLYRQVPPRPRPSHFHNDTEDEPDEQVPLDEPPTPFSPSDNEQNRPS